MILLNVPAPSQRLAERAAVEYIRRTRRRLARVVAVNHCGQRGEYQVIMKFQSGKEVR
jgi:hypothetical protein